MQIETEYETEESIPAEVRHLFREDGERFALLDTKQAKAHENVARLEGALEKERKDHRAAKTQLSKFAGLDAEEVRAGLDRKDELEALHGEDGGEPDEKKAAAEEARIKARMAPLQREIDKLTQEAEERTASLDQLAQKDRGRRIEDVARKAATDAKLNDTGMNNLLFYAPQLLEENEDGVFVTREGVNVPGATVTAGVPIDVALTELQASPAYRAWWPESKGGGSRGGDGSSAAPNPWKQGDGFNMTKQGEILRADRARAEQLARAAGVTIGGDPLAA